MNSDEWGKVWGLPYEAQLLYWAIRRRRDYKTGVAGVKTTLSWNALTEDLEVPSTPGRKSYRPTQNKLRHYAELLVKCGLLENLTEKADRKLIFSCLLATRYQSVSQRFNRSSTDNINTPEHAENTDTATVTEDFSAEVEHTKNQEVQHTSQCHSKHECVSDTKIRQQFFDDFSVLVSQEIFTERELLSHIDDYLEHNAGRGSRPNRNGLANMLKARAGFRRQAVDKIRAIDELRQSEVEKFNALAEREQQRADHIASETIYRQRNPMRH